MRDDGLERSLAFAVQAVPVGEAPKRALRKDFSTARLPSGMVGTGVLLLLLDDSRRWKKERSRPRRTLARGGDEDGLTGG